MFITMIAVRRMQACLLCAASDINESVVSATEFVSALADTREGGRGAGRRTTDTPESSHSHTHTHARIYHYCPMHTHTHTVRDRVSPLSAMCSHFLSHSTFSIYSHSVRNLHVHTLTHACIFIYIYIYCAVQTQQFHARTKHMHLYTVR